MSSNKAKRAAALAALAQSKRAGEKLSSKVDVSDTTHLRG